MKFLNEVALGKQKIRHSKLSHGVELVPQGRITPRISMFQSKSVPFYNFSETSAGFYETISSANDSRGSPVTLFPELNNPAKRFYPGGDLTKSNDSNSDNVTLFVLGGASSHVNSTLNGTAADEQTKSPILGILLCTFVVIVIVGNLLVIVAVAKERYLRSVTNYLIVSLAVADLMVGGIVMPFSIIQEIMSGFWVFGPEWCDIWHSFDVLGSTASILNLCVIALDRYWAITDPIAYPTKMSTKRVWILIALVWVCSSAISFPAILWWRAVAPEIRIKSTCEFTDDSSYLLISSLVSFYVPLFIMVFVYYRIYTAATQRTKTLNSGGKIVTTEGCRGEVMTLRMHRGKKDVNNQRNGHEHLTYQRAPFTDTETDSASHFTRSDSEDDRRPARFIKKKIQKFAISRKLSKLAREQKAAKTLGIVMGVFVVCWVPFFMYSSLKAICHESCIGQPGILFPIFTWLGYLNSGMNPIIYALSMRDFRRAFKRIMCMYCPKNPLPIVTAKKKKETCVRSLSNSSFSGNISERYTAMKL